MAVLASRLNALRPGQLKGLAESAGLTGAKITKWTKGLGDPRLGELEALADALGVPVAFLISRDDAVTFEHVPDDILRRVHAELQHLKAVAAELSARATEIARRQQPLPKGPRQSRNGRKKRQKE